MSTDHADRRPGEPWEDRPAGGWHEYAAARGRFLARLASDCTAWREARGLPPRTGDGYSRRQADQAGGARSR